MRLKPIVASSLFCAFFLAVVWFARIGLDVTLEKHYLARYGLDSHKAAQIRDIGSVLFEEDRELPSMPAKAGQ